MSVGSRTKDLLRQVLRRAGLVVQRYSIDSVPDSRLAALLAHHHIDLVLDVGANAGQYAQALRRSGYRERILSFEPLRDAWERCATQAASDPAWTVAPRMALGATNGEAEIHVAANSASSSILPMREAHRASAPHSTYIGREKVPLRRLDDVAAGALEDARHPFLKLDTQGYEREILAGATGLLPRLRGIQIEMSLTPLYEGSPSFQELFDAMYAGGFSAWALLPGFSDRTSGRMLQVDGLFFRDLLPDR